MSTFARTPRPNTRSAALLSTLLVACGGSDMPPEPLAPMSHIGLALASPARDPIPPLLADDGSAWPSAPQALPADTGAHTRAGRYASRAQADQLEGALGAAVLRIVVHGGSAAAVEEALAVATARLAAHDQQAAAPVLVEGPDLRSAAALVERLAALGVGNTWLVTS